VARTGGAGAVNAVEMDLPPETIRVGDRSDRDDRPCMLSYPTEMAVRRLRIEIFGVGVPLIVALSSFLVFRLATGSGGPRAISVAALLAGLGFVGVGVLLQRHGGGRSRKTGGWVVIAALLGASQVVTSTRTGQSASVAFFDGILVALLVRSVLVGHFMYAVRSGRPE
jgi:hypothetical protein